MARSDEVMPEIVTEAIVVIDIVESALTSNLFGWYAVGRHALRDLRLLIGEVGANRGLRCLKNTGDGYLATFYDPRSAEMAAVRAVEASFDLLDRIATRNAISLKNLHSTCAAPPISARSMSYQTTVRGRTFRLQEISRASLPLNPIPPEQFPLQNYVLCREEVARILSRRAAAWERVGVGLLKLKGFPGWREAFRFLPAMM